MRGVKIVEVEEVAFFKHDLLACGIHRKDEIVQRILCAAVDSLCVIDVDSHERTIPAAVEN